jgi:hypothetical protein
MCEPHSSGSHAVPPEAAEGCFPTIKSCTQFSHDQKACFCECFLWSLTRSTGTASSNHLPLCLQPVTRHRHKVRHQLGRLIGPAGCSHSPPLREGLPGGGGIVGSWDQVSTVLRMQQHGPSVVSLLMRCMRVKPALSRYNLTCYCCSLLLMAVQCHHGSSAWLQRMNGL